MRRQQVRLLRKIDSYNKQRRIIEERARKSCLEQIAANEDSSKQMAYAMFGEDFHLGVIGIVAQRIVEKYNKPAAVMTRAEITENGRTIKVIKGSVRSISDFHVSEVLSELGEHLLQHGGHAAAGGFSLLEDKLESFQKAFVTLANEKLTDEMCRRKRVVDAECCFSELDFDTVAKFESLSPFGIGNPSPLLITKDVKILNVKSVGDNHLKLRVSEKDSVLDGVFWNSRGHKLAKKGNVVSLLYVPEINVYQGLSTVQLNLKEIVE